MLLFLGLLCFQHMGFIGKERSYFNFDQIVAEGIIPVEGVMQNKCNMQPVQAHYACLVDLLSRPGHLEEAHKITDNI